MPKPGVQTRTAYVWGQGSSWFVQLPIELERLGYQSICNPPLPEQEQVFDAGGAPSFVFVENEEDEQAFVLMSAISGCVIAVVDTADATLLRAVSAAGAAGVLDLPLRPVAIAAQIEMAQARMSREQRLESKLGLLERTLKSRREIEKATLLMAASRDISTPEAYQVLRRAAMARRKSIAELAQEIGDEFQRLLSTMV